MKISLGADELDDLDAMSDEDLSALVRESLAKFRSKRTAKDNDLDDADPSSAAHGGRSESTLETSGSRAANTNTVTGDSVQKLRERGFSEGRIREALATSNVSAADRRAAAKLVPSLGRLK